MSDWAFEVSLRLTLFLSSLLACRHNHALKAFHVGRFQYHFIDNMRSDEVGVRRYRLLFYIFEPIFWITVSFASQGIIDQPVRCEFKFEERNNAVANHRIQLVNSPCTKLAVIRFWALGPSIILVWISIILFSKSRLGLRGRRSVTSIVLSISKQQLRCGLPNWFVGWSWRLSRYFWISFTMVDSDW